MAQLSATERDLQRSLKIEGWTMGVLSCAALAGGVIAAGQFDLQTMSFCIMAYVVARAGAYGMQVFAAWLVR